MGTWGPGPFDNDTAADFADTLDETAPEGRAALVRDALLRAADTPGYLDAGFADEAVAAAALVAAQCPGGEGADPVHGPGEPLPDLTGLRPLAVEALDRVLSAPSELLELWAGPGGAPWRAGVGRLRDAPLPEPPGERPRLA